MTLAQAIARMEGWYAKESIPNRCQRNNNPGNLEYNEFTIQMKAIGTDGRFAKFSNAIDGWIALYTLLIRDYSELTLNDAINKYAPSYENNTNEYVDLVCQWTEHQSTDLVSECLL